MHKCRKILAVCSLAALLSADVMPSVCLAAQNTAGTEAVEFNSEDGEYSIQVDLEGGSGKASVTSPTLFTVEDGHGYARIQWSSSNYDYMIVDGEKYLPTNEEGMNSVFEIPILALDEPVSVIADTTDGVRILTGYDQWGNISFYKPGADDTYLLSDEDSLALFEKSGNLFIGFLDKYKE